MHSNLLHIKAFLNSDWLTQTQMSISQSEASKIYFEFQQSPSSPIEEEGSGDYDTYEDEDGDSWDDIGKKHALKIYD